jgi:hypothetical protein
MEIIGQGGVWKVYGSDDQKHVFRVPLGSSDFCIKEFIKHHKLVKSLGLPTLQKVEKHEINGEVGLICEDLNISSERTYVTHNSLYSDSAKDRDDILEVLAGRKKENRPLSIAEQFRHQNKLDEIFNFEDFIKSIKVNLEFVTGKNVVVDYDSYFFGTLKDATQSSINYIIADLDHIRTFTDESREAILKENFSEFNRAMDGFLRHFVTSGKRNEYLRILNDLIPA